MMRFRTLFPATFAQVSLFVLACLWATPSSAQVPSERELAAQDARKVIQYLETWKQTHQYFLAGFYEQLGLVREFESVQKWQALKTRANQEDSPDSRTLLDDKIARLSEEERRYLSLADELLTKADANMQEAYALIEKHSRSHPLAPDTRVFVTGAEPLAIGCFSVIGFGLAGLVGLAAGPLAGGCAAGLSIPVSIALYWVSGVLEQNKVSRAKSTLSEIATRENINPYSYFTPSFWEELVKIAEERNRSMPAVNGIRGAESPNSLSSKTLITWIAIGPDGLSTKELEQVSCALALTPAVPLIQESID